MHLYHTAKLSSKNGRQSGLHNTELAGLDLYVSCLDTNIYIFSFLHSMCAKPCCSYVIFIHLSRLVGKPIICICENKDADQLRGNREADQRLCFRYSDSTIPLLLKSKISSFWLFSVLVQAGLCQTCSETTLLVFPRGGSFVFSVMDLSL